mgnify:CR=1 FL=1
MRIDSRGDFQERLTIKFILTGFKLIFAIDKVRLFLFTSSNLAVKCCLLSLKIVSLLVQLLHV